MAFSLAQGHCGSILVSEGRTTTENVHPTVICTPTAVAVGVFCLDTEIYLEALGTVSRVCFEEGVQVLFCDLYCHCEASKQLVIT